MCPITIAVTPVKSPVKSVSKSSKKKHQQRPITQKADLQLETTKLNKNVRFHTYIVIDNFDELAPIQAALERIIKQYVSASDFEKDTSLNQKLNCAMEDYIYYLRQTKPLVGADLNRFTAVTKHVAYNKQWLNSLEVMLNFFEQYRNLIQPLIVNTKQYATVKLSLQATVEQIVAAAYKDIFVSIFNRFLWNFETFLQSMQQFLIMPGEEAFLERYFSAANKIVAYQRNLITDLLQLGYTSVTMWPYYDSLLNMINYKELHTPLLLTVIVAQKQRCHIYEASNFPKFLELIKFLANYHALHRQAQVISAHIATQEALIAKFELMLKNNLCDEAPYLKLFIYYSYLNMIKLTLSKLYDKVSCHQGDKKIARIIAGYVKEEFDKPLIENFEAIFKLPILKNEEVMFARFTHALTFMTLFLENITNIMTAPGFTTNDYFRTHFGAMIGLPELLKNIAYIAEIISLTITKFSYFFTAPAPLQRLQEVKQAYILLLKTQLLLLEASKLNISHVKEWVYLDSSWQIYSIEAVDPPHAKAAAYITVCQGISIASIQSLLKKKLAHVELSHAIHELDITAPEYPDYERILADNAYNKLMAEAVATSKPAAKISIPTKCKLAPKLNLMKASRAKVTPPLIKLPAKSLYQQCEDLGEEITLFSKTYQEPAGLLAKLTHFKLTKVIDTIAENILITLLLGDYYDIMGRKSLKEHSFTLDGIKCLKIAFMHYQETFQQLEHAVLPNQFYQNIWHRIEVSLKIQGDLVHQVQEKLTKDLATLPFIKKEIAALKAQRDKIRAATPFSLWTDPLRLKFPKPATLKRQSLETQHNYLTNQQMVNFTLELDNLVKLHQEYPKKYKPTARRAALTASLSSSMLASTSKLRHFKALATIPRSDSTATLSTSAAPQSR